MRDTQNADRTVELYIQPGSSSCLRTKELLSKLGVEFEAINVHNNPEGLARLQRLGARTVPVVAVGDRWAHGLHTQEVAELVGKAYQEKAKLPPDQLVEKLDLVLAASQRYIRQVPDDKLDLKSPDRDRPLRGVAYHTFRLVQAFLDADAGKELTIDALAEPAPPSMATGAAIADYGEQVRGNVRAWWAKQAGRSFQDTVPTYYGPEPLHDLLERTTWHAAQHVRHLILFLSWIDIKPDGPLTEADFAGLPLPDAVWS